MLDTPAPHNTSLPSHGPHTHFLSLITLNSPLPWRGIFFPSPRHRRQISSPPAPHHHKEMGCGVKEKSLRQARKLRHSSSAKPPPLDPNHNPNFHLPNPNPNPNSSFDDAGGWGYCNEEQLEELLLKNLDFVYKEALSRLISLGHDETLALRAMLNVGHCYGSMDVFSNILHNTLAHLNSGDPASAAPFTDLRHLQEYSLAGLVCLLQQIRPQLTRGDALWCLLMSELHVGRATAIEIPSVAASPGGPVSCKLHDPKRRISIPLRLRSNGSDPESKEKELAVGLAAEADVAAGVLKSLESMSIEDQKPEDQMMKEKKERVLVMIQKIRDLEGQVMERKEWAQQKAMQAAKKLSNDLTELKVLRMEREESQRVKGTEALEDTTMKRLSEMETALKKVSGQADRVNAVVTRLKAENAEIRAEVEASKLSASESANTCLEVAKREKRCLKRLLAWEKQRVKLQEEIAEERKKIDELDQQLSEVRKAQKQAEVKWRQEIKAKEEAITLVEEESRAKEAADTTIKRNHEALRRKIEVDFQRHKDDIHRLEEELSRVRASTVLVQPTKPFSNAVSSGDSDMPKPVKESNTKIVQGSNKPQILSRKNRNRECVICLKEDVNVVLLPCAHQVLCVGCSVDQEMRGRSNCPCCNAQIEQRIPVYGASC